MEIAKEKVVSIDYTLKDEEGNVLDTSQGKGPLAYLHGAGNIIPGLENALEGKSAGESLNVKLSPADAYGEHVPELVQDVPRENFPPDAEIKAGMQFQAQTPEGPRLITVVETKDNEITIDANHPLSGKSLNFDVNVIEVRDATAEEVEHGHAHGQGGHHH